MFAGRPAEAIEEIASSIRLIPHHPNWILYPLALAYFWHGDLEKAINVCTDYVGKEPGDAFGQASLAVTLSTAGRSDDAKKIVTNLTLKFPTFSVQEYARPQRYKNRKHIEQLTQALRELGLPERS